MIDFEVVLQTLGSAEVEFILVGGAAAIAHGSSRLTQDIDVVYRRSPENHDRLVNALSPLEPYLRGAPRGLPFRWDKAKIESGLNFTLTTTIGDIDLLGDVIGCGSYEDLYSHCVMITAFGIELRCVDLPTLIRLKRAAGRPKDLEAIAELQAILEERNRD